MLDFACKRLELDQIIKCSFSLSKSEFGILMFLMKNIGHRFMTDELADVLNLDKSTIQRSVKKLHKKGLIVRGQINQSRGGYVYNYKVKDRVEVRKMIVDVIDLWASRVKKEVFKW
jgi:predicted transcriptional regulator